MTRLILGCAEFHPTGYDNKPAVSFQEVRSILALAKEGGINMLDTADSYGCHELIKKEAKGFCIYTKTRDWKVNLDWGNNELRGILYHYGIAEKQIDIPFVHRWVNLGASVYHAYQVPEDTKRILQVPLNIMDSSFSYIFENYRTVFVRSVFARGRALDQHTVKECLDHVKKFRPDGVIVGVNKAKELNEILKAWGA